MNHYEEHYDTCPGCGYDLCDWVECHDCGGEGYSYHDCGEDTCCCLYPEDNVRCSTCDGDGGWSRCLENGPECRRWTPTEWRNRNATPA